MKKYLNFKPITGALIMVALISPDLTAQVFPGSNNTSGNYPSALGHNHTVGGGSAAFAAGMSNSAFGYTSVCFGENSQATSNYSMAFGTYCVSDSYYSFSKGHRAEAKNDFTMAYGKNVKATGHTSFVIGTGVSKFTGQQLINNIDNSLMIGFNVNNSLTPSVFVGPADPTIERPGKVAIGTIETPDELDNGNIDILHYTLYVRGGLLSDEVRVRTNWADYVFEDSYQLKPLFEVESFINTNGHLPNVPSAKEVEAGGIEIGDMTRIQQEKIEELTLYIIDLQKQINKLENRLDERDK